MMRILRAWMERRAREERYAELLNEGVAILQVKKDLRRMGKVPPPEWDARFNEICVEMREACF